MATTVSYFRGPRTEWRTGLPTYREVVYRDAWPGIDLVYSGLDGRLKYRLVVRPGADPASIRIADRGARAAQHVPDEPRTVEPTGQTSAPNVGSTKVS